MDNKSIMGYLGYIGCGMLITLGSLYVYIFGYYLRDF